MLFPADNVTHSTC